MISTKKSYIYSGTIRHRRFDPFDHFFTYPLFMTYIDLDSIDSDKFGMVILKNDDPNTI